MYCDNCGKEVANDSKFCRYCGKKLIKEMQQEEKNQEEIITSAACVYIELSENKKFKEECLKNSCTINTNTLIEKGLLDEKNVSKNQVIHIYLDQKVKKCIIK